MDDKKDKEMIELMEYFNRQISNVFKIVDMKDEISSNANVDRVRRMVKILRHEAPLLMLERSVDKLWDNKDAIMSRNLDFLMAKENSNKYIKNDERKEWLENLFNLIRNKYSELDKSETEYLWKCIDNMLKCAIKYRILQGNFTK
jgi:hypothetical protein